MTAFPTTPQEVTPAWLGEVLGADIAGVTTLDAHSGTTGRLRLGVEYASGTGPSSVFVKLPPDDEGQRKLVAGTDMGRREARFYAGPGAEVPMRIPTAYFAAAGEEKTQYVMVLEDLTASHCEFRSRKEPHAPEATAQLLESLAKVHAQFWNDPRFDDEFAWIKPGMRGPHGARYVASAKEQFAADLPPVFSELCDLYAENWEAICDQWDDGEQTLIHGDTHLGNHFVDHGTVGLYDWAVISRSPGIRDVSIYLGNSTDPAERAEHQEEWLRTYQRALVAAGVADAPTYETLLLRFRRAVLYGWVASTTTASMGSKWQPIEVGMLGMMRATETCAALDTLGAIREGL